MLEIIALIVLVGSLFGLSAIVYRKADLIAEAPIGQSGFNFKKWLGKTKNLSLIENFSFNIFLQKLISRVRILTLKTDNKTFSWLQKLRQKSRRKDMEEKDDYWQKVKSSTK